jgi:hypothetical protein
MKTRGGVASVIVVRPADDWVYGGTVQLDRGTSADWAAPEDESSMPRANIRERIATSLR